MSQPVIMTSSRGFSWSIGHLRLYQNKSIDFTDYNIYEMLQSPHKYAEKYEELEDGTFSRIPKGPIYYKIPVTETLIDMFNNKETCKTATAIAMHLVQGFKTTIKCQNT